MGMIRRGIKGTNAVRQRGFLEFLAHGLCAGFIGLDVHGSWLVVEMIEICYKLWRNE